MKTTSGCLSDYEIQAMAANHNSTIFRNCVINYGRRLPRGSELHAGRMPLAREFSTRLIADADYLTGANPAESLKSGRNNWRQIFDLIRSRDQ